MDMDCEQLNLQIRLKQKRLMDIVDGYVIK